MKSRFWILLLIFLAAAAAAALFLRPGQDSQTVLLYQDGELVDTIDLSRVTDAYFFRLDGPDSYNLVAVSPGSIAVTEAGCKSQTCVRHGPLTHGGTPIVCLPNKLVIRWADDAAADAVS